MEKEIFVSEQPNPGTDANGLNSAPSAERPHIGFFGRRNAGKSSLVNAVTGQNLSVVSDQKGTTTDPVKKSMELLPLGPVVIIDTPGFDDEGTLGSLRVEKTREILRKTDAAVLVIDAAEGVTDPDRALIRLFKARNIPFIVVFSKSDLTPVSPADTENAGFPVLSVSAENGSGITALKEQLAAMIKPVFSEHLLIGDKIRREDVVILVTPIDGSAPKGRLILPQVRTIRDILDSRAVCLVTQTEQLPAALAALKQPPALVITDSQDFEKVSRIISDDVKLTSFSILMARLKGVLDTAADGIRCLSRLRDGDTVLISEGCTHHRQCEDIGTVKIPSWIREYTKKQLNFAFTSGGTFPEDLSAYALIIHCGGCMLNEKEMQYRMKQAQTAGIQFTNYGILIAEINGILNRSLEIFYE